MISKALRDMSEAEREMLRNRVEQAADALDGVASPEFGELVALALLEKRGLSKGAMAEAIKSVPYADKGPKRHSVFAQIASGKRVE
ncbi:hypothetical protein X736_26945 [Mesorhizobium sp. L2C089B000]|nr:hypothetical protein X736_26945 [Mesorhizobium sp. L2C089B000]